MLPDPRESVTRKMWYRTAMRWRWVVFLLASAACSSGALALGRLDDASTTSPDASGDAGDGGICDPGLPTRHYAFDGVGTEIVDQRGGPSGRLLGGATLDGSGTLHLDGIDDYVDLPNGILAGLEEITVAAWIKHLGGGGYTRIFDFGTTSIGEDPATNASYVGRSYFAATPTTGDDPSGVATLLSGSGSGGEIHAATATFLGHTAVHQVVVVVAKGTLALYLDGARVARVARSTSLSAVDDVNDWLGRSNYAADPYLWADYEDFRVYDRALADCAIAATFAAGP